MGAVTIDLPDAVRAHLESQVQKGIYPDVSTYVQALIEADREGDEVKTFTDDAIREAAQIGIEQIRAGHYTDFTDATLPGLLEDVEQRGREALKNERKSQRG